MISTFHEANQKILDKVDKNGEPILKPTCVVDCCKNMGGVDLSDQIVQYSDILRKSLKWWSTLFFHLFNLMTVNAFLLYRKHKQSSDKTLHTKFRKSLMKSLLQEFDDDFGPMKR